MSSVPDSVQYTRTHEWARIEGENVTVGITDYAQSELGDVLFVELPKVGKAVESGKPCASLEAVKSVSDIYAPVSGTIIEVNENLSTKPDTVNKDPYGAGWMFKIKISSPDEIKNLMSADEYKKLIGE